MTYTCDVPSLDVAQHVVTYVNMDVHMTTLSNYKNALEILLVTETAIGPEAEALEHVHGNSSVNIRVGLSGKYM